jgi:polar amino acid transport system substrate-binding protein
MKSRILAALATCGVLALGLVAIGCGSNNNDNSSSTGSTSSSSGPLTATPGLNVSVDQKIADTIPAGVSSLTVASDATYPPMEFYGKSDNKTVIGADADLAKALGQVMGLDVQMQNVTFASIIPGLAAGKYNLGMSSFTDTKEREATVDFVTYLTAGTSIFTKADGGKDVTSLDELCGLNAAAEKGTTQEDDIATQDKKCKQEGKPGVTAQILPDQNGVNLALSSGRADAALADSPVAAYIVEQSGGQFKVTGGPFPPEPYGIAIPKDSGMAQPVLAAMKALIADGTYAKILDYWSLQDGAIDTPQINGAVS